MPTKHALICSLIGDSLALGAHWEYDQNRIAEAFTRIEDLHPPILSSSYHGAKNAGDLSHYGDQVLVLIQHVASNNGFELSAFKDAWLAFMQQYTGYMDRASREALQNLQNGTSPIESGARSNDFSAAARIAPLFTAYAEDQDALVAAARAQTLMTHGSGLIADGAEFFARTVYAILHGSSVKEALERATDYPYLDLPAEDWLAFTYMAADEDARMAISRFGQSCGMKGAFHGVVHLVTRYENDPQTALIENVMAGGDSCARGLMAGLILGARHGADAYKQQWADKLNAMPLIEQICT